MSPKALFSLPTSFPTFLLFSQFASQYSKNLVPHYSRSVVQRIPLYLTSLAVPESSALCLSSSRLVCYRLNILLCLSYRRARLARHYPEFVHRTTPLPEHLALLVQLALPTQLAFPVHPFRSITTCLMLPCSVIWSLYDCQPPSSGI